MKLNDDSHNTTMIQWSGKLINASSLPSPNDLWKQSNKKAAYVYFGHSNRLIRAAGLLALANTKTVTKDQDTVES